MQLAYLKRVTVYRAKGIPQRADCAPQSIASVIKTGGCSQRKKAKKKGKEMFVERLHNERKLFECAFERKANSWNFLLYEERSRIAILARTILPAVLSIMARRIRLSSLDEINLAGTRPCSSAGKTAHVIDRP